MTREIKFRAWDNKRRIFVGNDLLFAFANCALYYQRDKVIELRDGLQNPYFNCWSFIINNYCLFFNFSSKKSDCDYCNY